MPAVQRRTNRKPAGLKLGEHRGRVTSNPEHQVQRQGQCRPAPGWCQSVKAGHVPKQKSQGCHEDRPKPAQPYYLKERKLFPLLYLLKYRFVLLCFSREENKENALLYKLFCNKNLFKLITQNQGNFKHSAAPRRHPRGMHRLGMSLIQVRHQIQRPGSH